MYKQSHSHIVKRPDVYFVKGGSTPETIQLNIEPPTQFQSLGLELYERLVAEKLEEEAQKIKDAMIRLGQSFLGFRGIMQQHPFSSPVGREKR